MTKIFSTADIALAAPFLPLSASSAAEPRSADVSFAGLDLSSEAGQAIFDRRIENAVEAVCGSLTGKPTFDGAVRQCHKETRITARKSRDLAIANYGRGRLAESERKIRLVVR